MYKMFVVLKNRQKGVATMFLGICTGDQTRFLLHQRGYHAFFQTALMLEPYILTGQDTFHECTSADTEV